MTSPKVERDQLQKWLDFSRKIHSTLVLHEALETVLKGTMELTGTRRSCIHLFDPAGNLTFRLGTNRKGARLSMEDFSNGERWIKEALQKQQAIYFHEERQGSTACNGFCVPLSSQRSAPEAGRILGLLYADSPEKIDFGEQEKESINILALHAGPALEVASLYELATRDTAIGVYQRHYFDAMAYVEWKRTLRHRHPISVLIADLDHFKTINKTHGRDEGDALLRSTAAIIKDACRAEDIVARYGGDEFIALLPETDVAGAKRVARRIQEHMPVLPGEPAVTISIGAAAYPRCAVNSIQDLVKLADIALNHAKQAGGNRVVLYEPSLHLEHTKVFR